MTATAMEEDVFTGKMDFALWRKMLNFAVPHKGKISRWWRQASSSLAPTC